MGTSNEPEEQQLQPISAALPDSSSSPLRLHSPWWRDPTRLLAIGGALALRGQQALTGKELIGEWMLGLVLLTTLAPEVAKGVLALAKRGK